MFPAIVPNIIGLHIVFIQIKFALLGEKIPRFDEKNTRFCGKVSESGQGEKKLSWWEKVRLAEKLQIWRENSGHRKMKPICEFNLKMVQKQQSSSC